MPQLIRGAVLNNYVEVARSVGIDPYRLVAACNLPATCLTDAEAKVPAIAVARLLEASAGQAGRPDFGLLLAERRTLSNLGALALLVREQPTIRKALETLVGYIFLHSEALHLRMEEQDGLAILDFSIDVGRPIPLRQSIDLGLGFLHRSLRQLFRESWKPQMVCFTHAPPVRRDAHRRFSAPTSSSIRNSTASSAWRATSTRPCRPRMPRWRGMCSNISTRWRRAATPP